MTRILATQLNDEVSAGDDIEVRLHYEGQSFDELLGMKATSHIANGWEVVWDSDGKGFHATKSYMGNMIVTKKRYIRIVEE